MTTFSSWIKAGSIYYRIYRAMEEEKLLSHTKIGSVSKKRKASLQWCTPTSGIISSYSPQPVNSFESRFKSV